MYYVECSGGGARGGAGVGGIRFKSLSAASEKQPSRASEKPDSKAFFCFGGPEAAKKSLPGRVQCDFPWNQGIVPGCNSEFLRLVDCTSILEVSQ